MQKRLKEILKYQVYRQIEFIKILDLTFNNSFVDISYSLGPLLNVLLSNVMEIGNSYLDNVREEDI